MNFVKTITKSSCRIRDEGNNFVIPFNLITDNLFSENGV